MSDTNPIKTLQEDIYRDLLAAPYFEDVGVFMLRDGTIQAAIDRAVRGLELQNGKAGVAVSVLMAQMRVPEPNVPGPQPNASITIRCQEYPDINFASTFGARKSAEELALQVMRKCNHKFAVDFYSSLYFERDAGVPNYDYAPLVTYDVTALTVIPVDEWVQVSMPTITVDGAGLVHLDCITPGVQIWWTNDDTHPTPGNGTRPANGFLYAGPFAAGNAPYYLRAAAFDVSGVMRSSDVNRGLIPALGDLVSIRDEGGQDIMDEGGSVLAND